MGGNADLVDDLRDLRFDVRGFALRRGGLLAARGEQAAQMLAKAVHIKGLHQK